MNQFMTALSVGTLCAGLAAQDDRQAALQAKLGGKWSWSPGLNRVLLVLMG